MGSSDCRRRSWVGLLGYLFGDYKISNRGHNEKKRKHLKISLRKNYHYQQIFRKHMGRMGLSLPKNLASWGLATFFGMGGVARHLDVVGRMPIQQLAARISLGLGTNGYLGMFGVATTALASVTAVGYLSIVLGCLISSWMEYFQIFGFQNLKPNIPYSRVQMFELALNIDELKNVNISEVLNLAGVRHTLAMAGVRYG